MTESQLSALLNWLGPDRTLAGEVYQALHRRLAGLFRFWGSAAPEEAADETLSRAAGRLQAGEAVRTESRIAYLRGVARFVFLEELRRRGREREALRRAPEPAAGPDPAEARRTCLERCLQKLDPETRELILTYYRGQERERIDRRLQLATRLGINVQSLRNRMQRLRQKLQDCTGRCLDDTEPAERPLVE